MVKRHIHWGHVFQALAILVCILVYVWLFASFIDVNMHNDYFSEGYGEFAKWNAFVLFFD